MLNLFYEELDADRWIKYDRFPRRFVRRVVRGPARPGGQKRVFLNLCAGLDELGIDYRINDYRYVRQHPAEIACVIGKPFVLDKVCWENPILFGASVFSHPLEDPELFQRLPVKRVLVPGEWMRKMFEPHYGERVSAWPVGIDTSLWSPEASPLREFDVLLYDKIYWERQHYERTLLQPIRDRLRRAGMSFNEIRYGSYQEKDYHRLLQKSKAMIFLSAHETQGIAYQQALSMNVPIFAWDRGGEWMDPEYYPNRVRFGPVSSVPYWNSGCGLKFSTIQEFESQWNLFWDAVMAQRFAPRDYVTTHLSLRKCAEDYCCIAESITS